MRLKGQEIERFLAAPPDAVCLVLFYGPDQGLVRERAHKLIGALLPDKTDPFALIALSEEECRLDAARLRDEFSALSMWGGKRLIRMRINNERLSKQIVDFLKAHADGLVRGDALIVIEAGDLKPSSALRKSAENAPHAAALACYRDDRRALHDIITTTLKAAGLEADRGVLDMLAAALGGDRRMTRSELTKLILYKQAGDQNHPRVTEDDVRHVIATANTLGLSDIAYGAAAGRHEHVARSLDRCFLENESPVAVLRVLIRHWEQIQACRARMEGGASVKAAADALRPRPHFSRRAAFEGQVRHWTVRRTAAALGRLYQAELACKTTGMPAQAICRAVTLTLTRMAAGPARAGPAVK